MRVLAALLLAFPLVARAADAWVVAIANSDYGAASLPVGVEDLAAVAPGARDVSQAYAAVHGPLTLQVMMGSFANVKAPAFWPEALRGDWAAAAKGCEQEAAGDKGEGSRCGSRFLAAIWQRYLESTGATRFALLEWRYVPDKDGFELSALAHPVALGGATRSEKKLATVKTAKDVARALVRAATTGKGTDDLRFYLRELPGTAVAPDKDAMAFDFDPVALPGTCPLPALALEPSTDPLAESLVRRWKRSIPTRLRADTLTCRFVFPASLLMPVGRTGGLGSHHVALHCGNLHAQATQVHVRRYDESVQKQITAKLATSLAEQICAQ